MPLELIGAMCWPTVPPLQSICSVSILAKTPHPPKHADAILERSLTSVPYYPELQDLKPFNFLQVARFWDKQLHKSMIVSSLIMQHLENFSTLLSIATQIQVIFNI